jgi:hydrogenase/urease accessory protein HupE
MGVGDDSRRGPTGVTPTPNGGTPASGRRGATRGRPTSVAAAALASSAWMTTWPGRTLQVGVLLAWAGVAAAHPAPFSYLDLMLDAQGARGSVVLHDFDVAHELGIDPPDQLLNPTIAARHRARVEALAAERLRLTMNGEARVLRWTAMEVDADRFALRLAFEAGERPARVNVHAVMFPYDPVHQTFVNVYEDGSLRQQSILTADAPSLVFYAGSTQGRVALVRTFIASGVEHILIGPDHVLFLVGLLLLGGAVPRLALIVTAFTIGHSITLSLAALDIVNPPSRFIEPLIALTIVVVGADNLFVLHDRRRWGQSALASPPRDARPLFAGFFGLVHGFGFASVLREFGLPEDALVWSLVSFNVGVEIGQLVIVMAAAGALAFAARNRPTATARVVKWGSIAVILAGAYWFVERLFFSPR